MLGPSTVIFLRPLPDMLFRFRRRLVADVITVGASHSSEENFVRASCRVDADFEMAQQKPDPATCAKRGPFTQEYIADIKPNPINLAGFSSIGPTHDKRIKPDLVAPGHVVISAMGQEGQKEIFCGVRPKSLEDLSFRALQHPVLTGIFGCVTMPRPLRTTYIHPKESAKPAK